MGPFRPLARTAGLVIRDLPDELLVYDLERHKVSCLNRVAALVWRSADGRTSVPGIARKLRAEIGAPLDENAVWLALDRLDDARLIEGGVSPGDRGSVSRRDCMRELARIGVRAALLPTVASIVAPRAADAASVVGPNDCRNLPPGACIGQTCSNGKRCHYDASKGRCKCV